MSQELVVIIHGFAGSPWEIEPLAQALQREGYDVVTPLLPGHTITKERMKKITAVDWINAIEKIVKHAIGEKKNIHLIGFSMGAMIASIIASRYEVSTLILLSPALFVLTPAVLKRKLLQGYQQLKNKPSFTGIPSAPQKSLLRSAPLYNMFQFQKIVLQAKRIFQNISIPVCILHGLKDEIADPRSSRWIFHNILSKEKELHYLHFSKHHICQDSEIGTVIEKISSFIEKFH